VHGRLLLVDDAQQLAAVDDEQGQVAEGVVEVLAVAVDRARGLLDESLEGASRRLVEGPDHLVDLDRLLDAGALERGTVGELRRLRRSLRQLDVDLPQQRLLAQHRARVRRDRRELGVDLHLDQRPACRPVGLRLDPADREPGDAHLGLVDQQRRLVELGREAVALRRQRDRAAERDPEEQQQPEARQRERHHRGDPCG
jgi:hypothetical protein